MYGPSLPADRYPGDGYYYVYCDVCAKKLRAREAVLITDKYNRLANMLVCPQDVDITNPQAYIKSFRERQIDDPKLIRSEPSDTLAASVATVVSTQPRHMSIAGATSSFIEIQWFGPLEPGGSITGHLIERESPVAGGFSTLVADTGSAAGYFKDTTVSASTQYNYRVSVLTGAGTGAASDEVNATTPA